MKNHRRSFIVIFITLFITLSNTYSQNKPELVAGIPVNYDESLTGTYTLPDPLIMANGKKVKNTRIWEQHQRPALIRLFEEEEYGKMPDAPENLSFNVFDQGTPVFSGKAIRKQITVYLTKDTSDHKMEILIYLPADARGPVPLFLNIGFSANSSITDDPGVKQSYIWGKNAVKVPAPKAGQFGRVNIDPFISQGIAYGNIYYGDIEPDFGNGVKLGIRGAYLKPGQKQPEADEWGAISAWAWGLSRAMDYFETDKQIDPKKVALFGVSRLGKTVLWAGVHDQRFGMVIASCSGEGGAALSRRDYGETIRHMVDSTRYDYQFCTNRQKYADDPSKSPVEANMLVALMAPRPLLLQTGDTDKWSDPKGEFLAAAAAGPVYRLFGKKDLGTDVMPEAGRPILGDLSYYMHSGGHGAMPADYPVFIDFMKMHFLNQSK